MNNRYFFPFVAFALLLVMALYFFLNPSYEKSLRAKYYYELGDYREALKLSKEAFSQNVYNRMASTVMAQSITSLKYVEYIEDAKKYKKELDIIATHDVISKADRAKIRLICEIMLSSYKKLAPSVVTDKTLVEDAAKYHREFEKLLEKVHQ
jgi:tetratricopeptide (TPR) repeat protein